MTAEMKSDWPVLPEKNYLGDDASYGYDESDMRDYGRLFAEACLKIMEEHGLGDTSAAAAVRHKFEL